MRWKDWYYLRQRRLISAILFVIAYILTIPIRGYEFLDGFIDTEQGVPVLAHLILIVFGVIVLMILHKIIEIIVKRYIIDR